MGSRWVAVGLWGAWLIGLAGCAEELRPTPTAHLELSGQVHDGSRPISGGWIEFVPLDGTVGHLRSAELKSDGTFRATGLGRGRHLIRLVQPRVEAGRVEMMFQQFSSPLRVEIDGQTTLDLDLSAERIKLMESPPPHRSARRAQEGTANGNR